LALFLLAHPTGTPAAADISFFCTDASAPSMRELVPAFETASGHRVQVIVANAGTIAARLQEGEAADLAIVLPPAWDRLRDQGRIEPKVRVILGKVGLGVFVASGAARPDISTVEAFKQAIAMAKKVAVRDPAQRSPVGTYMLGLFDRLALTETVRPKLLLTAHPPFEEVIAEQADLGFSTLAEIAAQPRAQLVGPLPSDIQTYNVMTAAIPVAGSQPAAAADLLRFLGSPSSKAVLRATGVATD
jgi:molybdate transport system substrate-binding protein